MSDDRLSTKVEATIEALHSGMPARSVPLFLAQRWPDTPSLELVLVMISAADGVEATMAPRDACCGSAQSLWRVAALLAAEVHALQVSGCAAARAADLLDHWHRAPEGFFLPTP